MFRPPYPFKTSPVPGHLPRRLVVVCGTRTFDDGARFQAVMDEWLYWREVAELVIGGPGHRYEKGGYWHWSGADYFANVYAEANWLTRHLVRPDWEKHGKAAGPMRNREMAEFVRGTDRPSLVAFWNGVSRGTQSMLKEFARVNPTERIKVIRYRPV